MVWIFTWKNWTVWSQFKLKKSVKCKKLFELIKRLNTLTGHPREIRQTRTLGALKLATQNSNLQLCSNDDFKFSDNECEKICSWMLPCFEKRVRGTFTARLILFTRLGSNGRSDTLNSEGDKFFYFVYGLHTDFSPLKGTWKCSRKSTCKHRQTLKR